MQQDINIAHVSLLLPLHLTPRTEKVKQFHNLGVLQRRPILLCWDWVPASHHKKESLSKFTSEYHLNVLFYGYDSGKLLQFTFGTTTCMNKEAKEDSVYLLGEWRSDSEDSMVRMQEPLQYINDRLLTTSLSFRNGIGGGNLFHDHPRCHFDLENKSSRKFSGTVTLKW